MPLYERHLFICCNTRPDGHPRGCCASRGGEAVRDALRTELKNRGLNKRIRANQSACLDQCEHGATVVVYPDQVWYGFVKPEDAAEIVEKHLIGGEPVKRLMLDPECVNTPACAHRGPAKIG
ncbi:MAG: (2Fe-2S) ferredoxin domain-containing protein [Phycisphaerales bacterium]|nr:(2Fe-2S) ferredoxin domain-containing protein [Phycisphaerales bacterium]